MNKDLLHTEVQLFINQNLNSDLTKLVLRGSPFPHIRIQELVEQIKSKSKVKRKLPVWFHSKQIFYPNSIHLEQSSSEITAKYKASLVSGHDLIDLTGGFAIDTFGVHRPPVSRNWQSDRYVPLTYPVHGNKYVR